ncbi:RecT family recombinase [Yersinia intermedia]|uniref:RecT family recombinase n=1 Tax=Yersinia intermedia TaxID=631 RepID=UPI0011A84B2C
MTDIANIELSNEPAITNANVAIFNPQNLMAIQNFATLMASGKSTIPAHLAGNKADCMAVAMQAVQWGMNPFVVAQKTHVVSGTLGYEAQLVNAVIYAMAPTKDRIHYDWFGPWENVIGKFAEKVSKNGNKYIAPDWTLADEKGLGVRVWATMKGEDEPRVLTLLLSQAQVRNSTLWASDPKQQLAYLAVKRWSRLYCPEVILGVYSTDELDGKPKPERDVTPRTNADLNKMINTKKAEPIEGELETTKVDERSPDALLADFTNAASNAKSVEELEKFFKYTQRVLAAHHDQLEKATDIYGIRKAEMEEVPM